MLNMCFCILHGSEQDRAKDLQNRVALIMAKVLVFYFSNYFTDGCCIPMQWASLCSFCHLILGFLNQQHYRMIFNPA